MACPTARWVRAVLYTGVMNPDQDLDLATTTHVWELGVQKFADGFAKV